MKKYAVIIGNNQKDRDDVLTALDKAGFQILGFRGNRNKENWSIITINEFCPGQVGRMSYDHTDRLVNHSNGAMEILCSGAMEILFPEDVINMADKLDGAKPRKPATVKMTMTEVCKALGKNIEIVEG